jgi:hypothetical protein
MSIIYVRKNGVFVPISMGGGGNSGGSTVRVVNIDLPADGWTGSDKRWEQVVSVPGSTINSEVNLTPSMDQLEVFYEKDLTFSTVNRSGVITVQVIGQKPQNDYVIQADVVEVTR